MNRNCLCNTTISTQVDDVYYIEGKVVDWSDITNKPTIPDITKYYTKTEIDSKGYLTQHQSLSDYAKKSELPNLSNYYTKSQINGRFVNNDFILVEDNDVSIVQINPQNTCIQSEIVTTVYGGGSLISLENNGITMTGNQVKINGEVISNYMKKSQADMAYAAKSTTYTKTEIDTMIGNLEDLLDNIITGE